MQIVPKGKIGRSHSPTRPLSLFKVGGIVFKTVAVALMFAWCLAACAESRVNQDNFEKIRIGMTLAEVKAILGEPTESSSLGVPLFSGTTAVWKSGDVTINIQLVNGKVVAKEFLKPGSEARKARQ